MDLSTIDTWAWILWLVVILLFLVIEMITVELTFLMLALGGIVGLVADLGGAPPWVQVILAAAAAIALVVFLRPRMLRRLQRTADTRPSNVEALIGLDGLVLATVSRVAGQVKLANGDVWTARSDIDTRLDPGTPVEVARIDGATAVVRAREQGVTP
ncbi:NfeD family protein [Microbacterium sp. B19]|uniref:NfeD family protein n=1 Tax=Microbacterium sp. B19 TaxID=96765 RepID=UPI00034B3794|nr:NfeD family protein [Microbacterium sp. B19]